MTASVPPLQLGHGMQALAQGRVLALSPQAWEHLPSLKIQLQRVKDWGAAWAPLWGGGLTDPSNKQ